ncbi:hypothetical protein C3489_28920 [Streptomyces sp. Ru71]|uniref:hypothetical protein n=1 Tax=Streptomyces sp. Ru71 TaxID=2080746 RepID=UPI000CDDA768|nr:hypothetical protein [Streptomyces sp. Ru71]POX47707.1 hypothetical protein C3489_28920 [Streptomyces sp. Ru71]
MPRRRRQPPVRYTVIEHAAHQSVVNLHGYVLGRSGRRGRGAGVGLRPTGVIAAVERLDAAQSGPAAAEPRILRRYAYAWSLRWTRCSP